MFQKLLQPGLIGELFEKEAARYLQPDPPARSLTRLRHNTNICTSFTLKKPTRCDHVPGLSKHSSPVPQSTPSPCHTRPTSSTPGPCTLHRYLHTKTNILSSPLMHHLKTPTSAEQSTCNQPSTRMFRPHSPSRQSGNPAPQGN
ncbi:hypothetical protein L207DRAFT_260446 [Hyaloscypha variabilis F]|uniref:Uncharacterized protein n=1 Tax=Hyaloscypha variabilis (strain UAMH 11265 / GT02V1 / F) TaxID=1149755 RepID=A0A2J6S4Y4_HYAVF|nr:hypothetical protein L207DRAFT_260446 [Hyaloscypha variabilis F]